MEKQIANAWNFNISKVTQLTGYQREKPNTIVVAE